MTRSLLPWAPDLNLSSPAGVDFEREEALGTRFAKYVTFDCIKHEAGTVTEKTHKKNGRSPNVEELADKMLLDIKSTGLAFIKMQ